MIGQLDIYGKTKVETAIEWIRKFEPEEGYYLGFSGGKDSVVLYTLAVMAGVKFEAHCHLTTVDPPELIRFIRKYYPDVILDKPAMNMWDLIADKGFPPTRVTRYCCKVFKEGYGEGRIVLTGVRWAESPRRRETWGLIQPVSGDRVKDRETGEFILSTDNDDRRRIIEHCLMRNRMVLHPIIDWTDEEVWEFIRVEKAPYCPIYDEGFRRIGCIGCPMADRHRWEQFERWPHFFRCYLRAFERMAAERERQGKKNDKDALGWMAWWMECELDDPKLLRLVEILGL